MNDDPHGTELGQRIASSLGLRVETRLTCPSHRQEAAALVVAFEGERVLWIKASRSRRQAAELAELEATIAHHEQFQRRRMVDEFRARHADIKQHGGTTWPDTAFPLTAFEDRAIVTAACPRCHRRVRIVVSNGSARVSV